MERPLETIQPEEKGISNSLSNFLKEKNHLYNPTEDWIVWVAGPTPYVLQQRVKRF